jgi:uncharacterized protein
MPRPAHADEPAPERWLNEPRSWRRDGGQYVITADLKTDFWRRTCYGYITDNGHFLYRRISGDFVTTVQVAGDYAALYDQAGLMVRENARTWLKCGIELVDGRHNVSTVFTRDYSDWSPLPLADAPAQVWMRVSRKGGAFTVSYSRDGKSFQGVRQGWLTAARSVDVGLMCAAPEGAGFEARFSDWTIAPAPVQ